MPQQVVQQTSHAHLVLQNCMLLRSGLTVGMPQQVVSQTSHARQDLQRRMPLRSGFTLSMSQQAVLQTSHGVACHWEVVLQTACRTQVVLQTSHARLVSQSRMPLRSGLSDSMPDTGGTTEISCPTALTESHATEKWSYSQHATTGRLTDFS